MKKKIISVLLAAMISVSGAASINAYTEQELMQAQEYTKYALNETYAALNNLWAQKQEQACGLPGSRHLSPRSGRASGS